MDYVEATQQGRHDGLPTVTSSPARVRRVWRALNDIVERQDVVLGWFACEADECERVKDVEFEREQGRGYGETARLGR
jgi:hypothetical protein